LPTPNLKIFGKQSTPILPVDAPALIKKTYLELNPTPFELYVKFLIEFFGKNIEYDPDSISDIPLKRFKKLSYQIDAVNQGYELLLKTQRFLFSRCCWNWKNSDGGFACKEIHNQ
jgi:hypothetical protein